MIRIGAYLTHMLRGLVKLKKIDKSEKKLGLSRPQPPTRLSIFFIFLETCTTTKTTQKTQYFKKKKSELGLDPPTHFRVFLGFLDFFKLTIPLTTYAMPVITTTFPAHKKYRTVALDPELIGHICTIFITLFIFLDYSN